MLALIGRHWSAVTDVKGVRRIDYRQDWVRVEIETALQRNIRVVPVLVDGAALPQAADLPPSLPPLVQRQAFALSLTGFRSDVSRLIAAVDEVLEAGLGLPADATPMDRLVQQAREIPWGFRPSKQYLEPVAAVLLPQERVLGTCLVHPTLSVCFSLTVTNRNLYLSTDKNSPPWAGLRERTPSRFRAGERVLKIPLTVVDTCAIINHVFTIQIRGEPAITFNHYRGNARNTDTWIQKYMRAAQGSA